MRVMFDLGGFRASLAWWLRQLARRVDADGARREDEREEAFRDLAEVAYDDREAVWTSPRVLVSTALRKRDPSRLADLVRRLAVGLDYCCAYLPPADADERARRRGSHFPIIDPLFSREDAVRLSDEALRVVGERPDPERREQQVR